MDARDLAGHKGIWYTRIDDKSRCAILELAEHCICLAEELGLELEGECQEDCSSCPALAARAEELRFVGKAGLAVPIEYRVCPLCRGTGTHVNPAIDADHGLTAEDFDADPDFERDYKRGVYNVACYECHGDRVVPVPRLTTTAGRVANKILVAHEEMAREDAHNARMGY